jgi:hypothetical protein
VTKKVDTETRLRRLLMEARNELQSTLDNALINADPKLMLRYELVKRIERVLTDPPSNGETK